MGIRLYNKLPEQLKKVEPKHNLKKKMLRNIYYKMYFIQWMSTYQPKGCM
jgi:hypothetical protein